MFRRRPWVLLALVALGSATAAFAIYVGTRVFLDDPYPEAVPILPAALELVNGATAETLEAFGSPDDLEAYVARVGQARALQQVAEEAARGPERLMMLEPEVEEAASPGEPGGESITNTQEAGVDEGGIVKTHGDHLVVLRRGRLFSARLGTDGSMTPISVVDAYPPGARGGWYDEMLVSRDTIVVIGFDYGSSGTEIGRFHIDADGVLTRVDTHYLSSDDYYSSRNYASRLIGETLIFYMPYALLRPSYDDDADAPAFRLPGTRPADQSAWDSILDAQDIVRPVQVTADPVLHTVVSCDLSEPALRCRARAVLGPSGRSFYVSPEAVYIWVGSDRWGQASGDERAVVYRMPIDDDEPIGAVRVAGTPIDQFAFREADEHLSVMVRAEGRGDAMWGAEADAAQGSLALVRVGLSAFTDGVTTAPASAFTALPSVRSGSLHVRHVGEHLVYGAGAYGWGDVSRERELFVHPVAGGETTRVRLEHAVDRLDVLGERAVAIGGAEDGLHFSAIELGDAPRVVGTYVQRGAHEGESRSHGFFFRPRISGGGTLGLPIQYARAGAWARFAQGSAGVLFLDVADDGSVTFTPLGTLDATGHVTEDQCVASCTDWYGNARPIFYRGFVYALLGYELVEGRVEDGAITAVARTNLFEDLGTTAAEEVPIPEGFEPVVLPDGSEACHGPTIWIGPEATHVAPAPTVTDGERRFPEPDVTDLPEGVARDVARFYRLRNVLSVLTGSYNGPGGEPLFRYHLGQTPPRVLMFDRRVSRERFDAALEGTRNAMGWPVRLGGIDAEGRRRCVVVLREDPTDMGAQAENRVYDASFLDGALAVDGQPLRFDAPLPDEPSAGLHVVRVPPRPRLEPADLIALLAQARWSERRYPVLAAP